MKASPHRALVALLAVLAIAPVYRAFASGDSSDDNSQSQSNLVPPPAAPDANATGKVEISKEGSQQEFKVTGEKLDSTSPPGPFEAWLEDAVSSGVFVKIGNMSIKSVQQGRWELKLEANGGAPPALGVADVADLNARGVQVRDTGGVNVYLKGVIGTIGGGTCPPTIPAVKGEMNLQRPPSSPDPDAKGHLELSKKGHDQEFEVEAERLDADGNAQYDVFVETAVDSGVYTAIGGMVLQNTIQGRWKFKLEGECEAPPILGVNDVAVLTGRRVEVRNTAGNTVLAGPLPQLVSGVGQGNFNSKTKLALAAVNPPSPKAKGWVRSRYLAKKGQSDFEVLVRELVSGKSYSLWLETANGSGILENAGPFVMKGKSGKNGEFEVNTKKGAGLPFGVSTVEGLKGRALEVRDGQDVVYLTGIVP